MKTINNTNKLIGQLKIEHFNSKGVMIDSRFIPNLVVTSGKDYVASRMINASQAVMTHMDVGTGNTAPAIENASLQTPIVGARQPFNTAASVAGNVVSYSATFAPGVGTGAITEAGIFNAASAGTMLCRTTFSVVNKAAGDTINISWNITVA